VSDRRDLGISIVLHVFNEGQTVAELIPDLVEMLERHGRSFEIVAIDDGSTDESLESLKALRQRYPERLVVAQHLENRGNGASLRTGINLARGEIVVTMDADGQHAPEQIPSLLAEIPPYDLVVGARVEGYRGSWHRNLANYIYNRFASWLSGRTVLDLTSGFRAMRRQAVAHFLPLFPEGFSAPTTTTLAFLKAGYNVTFVPVKVHPRAAGSSKVRIWQDGSRFLLIILRMIMLYDPLRIFLPTSAGLVLLGVVAGGLGMLRAGRLVLANSAILLISAGLMVWLLGMVASQISSTMVSYYGDETIVTDGGSE
jgi:glycosyltransferase involved in cell wall biosynthesis